MGGFFCVPSCPRAATECIGIVPVTTLSTWPASACQTSVSGVGLPAFGDAEDIADGMPMRRPHRVDGQHRIEGDFLSTAVAGRRHAVTCDQRLGHGLQQRDERLDLVCVRRQLARR